MPKIVNLDKNQHFTDHAWANKDKIFLTNTAGNIFIIQKFELISMIVNGF